MSQREKVNTSFTPNTLWACMCLAAFSLLARIWREDPMSHSLPAPVFFFFFFGGVVKWRSSYAHLSHSLGQDQSTVAQQAEMTCDKHSLMSCTWVHFPDKFPYYARQHSQPTPILLGQLCLHVMQGVTCHLHFWQNDHILLCATAVTWGWCGHQIIDSTES